MNLLTDLTQILIGLIVKNNGNGINLIFSFCQNDLACNTALRILFQNAKNYIIETFLCIESIKYNFILDFKIQNSFHHPKLRIN